MPAHRYARLNSVRRTLGMNRETGSAHRSSTGKPRPSATGDLISSQGYRRLFAEIVGEESQLNGSERSYCPCNGAPSCLFETIALPTYQARARPRSWPPEPRVVHQHFPRTVADGRSRHDYSFTRQAFVRRMTATDMVRRPPTSTACPPDSRNSQATPGDPASVLAQFRQSAGLAASILPDPGGIHG